MPIEVTSLSELDPAKIEQLEAQIVQMVREAHPSLETRRGPIYDLLYHYMAALSAVNQENIERYRQSSSLHAIQQNPELADPEIVDAVLSNFRVTRRQGAAARGRVTIVVDRLATVTIPFGARFVSEGRGFTAVAAYVARTSAANTQTETDRVLVPLGDGTYSFDIEVVAEEEGSGSMLSRGALLVPDDTLSYYVTSHAAEDFTGGLETETNQELILRMQDGIACQALSNRTNMGALLRSLPGYENVLHSSIIGFGDPEMLRDRTGLSPLPCGGRVDWYIRTAEQPQQKELTLTASLVQKRSDNRGVWQLTIPRDAAPGFYDIYRVLPISDYNYTGSYTIISQQRDCDTTEIPGVLTPDLPDARHGYFSRYQMAAVQFVDSDTPVAERQLGDTQDYKVVVRAMPGIAELQATLGSLQHRNFGGDVLVKAPVPAMVSLGVTLNLGIGDPLPDPVAMREAIAHHVNTRGFSGKLYAAAISDILYNYLGPRSHASAVDLYTQILCPDRQVRTYRSIEALHIPNLPEALTTPRTCVFITQPEMIKISAQGVELPAEF